MIRLNTDTRTIIVRLDSFQRNIWIIRSNTKRERWKSSKHRWNGESFAFRDSNGVVTIYRRSL